MVSDNLSPGVLSQDLITVALSAFVLLLVFRMKDAAATVVDAAVAGLVAVREAWDNLDPGLKQWLISGMAMQSGFPLFTFKKLVPRSIDLQLEDYSLKV